MAAVTQISHRHSPGRAYSERKLAEGQTPKEALRSLKRRLSDVIFARLQADARRRGRPAIKSPGGHVGNDSVASAADSHPGTGSSAKPLPDPHPPTTGSHSPGQQDTPAPTARKVPRTP